MGSNHSGRATELLQAGCKKKDCCDEPTVDIPVVTKPVVEPKKPAKEPTPEKPE